jgi:fatty acid desaturase
MTTAARLIEPAELKRLSRRSDARGLLQLALHLLAVAASTSLVLALSDRIWLLMPAMLLQGWLLWSLFAPAHETSHYTAFESRSLNTVVGWICALPTLLNWHHYQLFHLAHHRHTQDPARDPELVLPAPRTRMEFLLRLTGWSTWRARLTVLVALAAGDAGRYAFVTDEARRRLVWSARAQLAVVLALGTALGVVDAMAPLITWIIPIVIAAPLMRAYLLAEHTGCAASADGLENTRTTLTNGFVRWTMWNMPFHAEHHLFPSIPFHALPAAHRRIADRLHHVARGYFRASRQIYNNIH